jgi:hypothetical protein
MFPMWVYPAVALAIAGMAFAIAQFAEGVGTMFVIGATTMWAAFSAYHGARRR